MLEIEVDAFKALMESGNPYQLIDVREPYEYEEANLGGTLIPLATIPEKMDSIRTDVDVYFLCRSGMRSQTAIKALQSKQDFNNLYNIKGGILAWLKQFPLPENKAM
jgi:sulfur-carrier protein adenylyltransferase/sulfurtransferase